MCHIYYEAFLKYIVSLYLLYIIVQLFRNFLWKLTKHFYVNLSKVNKLYSYLFINLNLKVAFNPLLLQHGCYGCWVGVCYDGWMGGGGGGDFVACIVVTWFLLRYTHNTLSENIELANKLCLVINITR